VEVLRQDAALQMDEILDRMEAQLTSSEVFTALFEWSCGAVRSLSGKNYVRSFEAGVSCQGQGQSGM